METNHVLQQTGLSLIKLLLMHLLNVHTPTRTVAIAFHEEG